MAEANLQHRIWMALSKLGLRLFRNQVGMAYQGKAERFMQMREIKVVPGDILIRQARMIRSGLCVGSSDLIGWHTVIIESKHIGKPFAQFVGVEVKTDGGHESAEQATFRRVVNEAGGLAIVARNQDDAIDQLNEER